MQRQPTNDAERAETRDAVWLLTESIALCPAGNRPDEPSDTGRYALDPRQIVEQHISAIIAPFAAALRRASSTDKCTAAQRGIAQRGNL